MAAAAGGSRFAAPPTQASLVAPAVDSAVGHRVYPFVDTHTFFIPQIIMSRETDPLMPSNASGNESSRYYFLNKPETTTSTTNNLVRDADGIAVVESVPEGTAEEEFAPRVLPPVVSASRRRRIW